LEKKNLSEQKKFGAKKINLAKKFFQLAKKVMPFETLNIQSIEGFWQKFRGVLKFLALL
jgi:hypothetical protein